LYALLLFGGLITVDHVRGGLTVGGRTEGTLRLRTWPRIAILVQQLRCVPFPFFSDHQFQKIHSSFPFFFGGGALDIGHRRLLDAALLRAFDSGRVLEVAGSPVVSAMLTLLMTDGMATIASRVGS
jgi:hypothetical protein